MNDIVAPVLPGAKNLEIVYRDIDSLIPYQNNARTHDDLQVMMLANSLKEFGWTNPILIDPDGNVIAGHGRLLAARFLQLKEVPCMILSGLTEAQRRAYIIADNQIALKAGWDEELLKTELSYLDGLDFDLSMVGFSDEELQEMLHVPVPSDDMPELPSAQRSPFQQMTFTLHDSQAERVVAAMAVATAMGPYGDSPNENSNGNALARICEKFLNHYANR